MLYSKLDLHSHSTASDGTLAPRALVEMAVQRGLHVLALTDHDSTEGVPEAFAAARGTGLDIWPGIEISTDVPGGEVHILGYLLDHKDQALQETLRELRESRVGRAQRMVEKLGRLGLPLDWHRVQEIAAGGAIGRPHVAQAMLERDYVYNLPEAFDRYIGRNGPAYVERFRLTPEAAVRLIVTAKGLAVLAHPVIVKATGETAASPNLDELLPRLVPAGLGGIEAYYAGYGSETSQRLLRVAALWDLVGTGGSDFHGRGTLTISIGEVLVPERVIDQVRSRHARQTGGDGTLRQSA